MICVHLAIHIQHTCFTTVQTCVSKCRCCPIPPTRTGLSQHCNASIKRCMPPHALSILSTASTVHSLLRTQALRSLFCNTNLKYVHFKRKNAHCHPDWIDTEALMTATTSWLGAEAVWGQSPLISSQTPKGLLLHIEQSIISPVLTSQIKESFVITRKGHMELRYASAGSKN